MSPAPPDPAGGQECPPPRGAVLEGSYAARRVCVAHGASLPGCARRVGSIHTLVATVVGAATKWHGVIARVADLTVVE